MLLLRPMRLCGGVAPLLFVATESCCLSGPRLLPAAAASRRPAAAASRPACCNRAMPFVSLGRRFVSTSSRLLVERTDAARQLRILQEEKNKGSQVAPAKALNDEATTLDSLSEKVGILSESLYSFSTTMTNTEDKVKLLESRLETVQKDAADLGETMFPDLEKQLDNLNAKYEKEHKRIKLVEERMATLENSVKMRWKFIHGQLNREWLKIDRKHSQIENEHDKLNEDLKTLKKNFLLMLCVVAGVLGFCGFVCKEAVGSFLKPLWETSATQSLPNKTNAEVDGHLLALLADAQKRRSNLTWQEWWQGDASRLQLKITAIQAVHDDMQQLLQKKTSDQGGASCELKFGDLAAATKQKVIRAVNSAELTWSTPLYFVFPEV